jgi:hypothetical protein
VIFLLWIGDRFLRFDSFFGGGALLSLFLSPFCLSFLGEDRASSGFCHIGEVFAVLEAVCLLVTSFADAVLAGDLFDDDDLTG